MGGEGEEGRLPRAGKVTSPLEEGRGSFGPKSSPLVSTMPIRLEKEDWEVSLGGDGAPSSTAPTPPPVMDLIPFRRKPKRSPPLEVGKGLGPEPESMGEWEVSSDFCLTSEEPLSSSPGRGLGSTIRGTLVASSTTWGSDSSRRRKRPDQNRKYRTSGYKMSPLPLDFSP